MKENWWLLYTAGILSGIVLTLVLRAFVLSWMSPPMDEESNG